MAGNIQRKLTIGIHPLSYLGVNAESPPNSVLLQNQDPTAADWQNFIVGDIWINENGNPNPANPRIWMLGSVSRENATWILIASGTGDVSTLTANSGGPVSPLLGNINVVGDGTTINIVGNPATHTLTVSAVGTGVVSSFVTDVGTATPIAGVIDILTNPYSGSSMFFSASATNNIRLTVTDGSNNTLIGSGAGNNTLTSSNNTGLGLNVLSSLTTGAPGNNVAVGQTSLHALTSGTNNVAIGAPSLVTLVTGSNNIAVGGGSGANYTGAESSNILVGNAGVLGESHVMRLGTNGSGAGQVNTAYIAGSTINIPNGQLFVNGAIQTTNGGIVAGSTNIASPAQFSGVTSNAGGAVANGNVLAKFEGLGNDGTNPATLGALMQMVVNGVVSANNVPTDLQFWTTPLGGALTQRMHITRAGNILMVVADSGVTLTCDGSIAAGGDEGGTATHTTITNATQAAGVGVNTLTGTTIGGGAQTNAGYLKMYVGATAVYVPYFLTP